MKKILFLMVFAISTCFAAKAQNCTINVTHNHSGLSFAITELHAYCPDYPGVIYEMNYATTPLGTGTHVLGGSGNWYDLSTGLPANPPCSDLVLLYIEYFDCNLTTQVANTNASPATTTGTWTCCTQGSPHVSSTPLSVQVNSSYWPISNNITVN